MKARRPHWLVPAVALLAAATAWSTGDTKELKKAEPAEAPPEASLRRELAALAPQRPGRPDLYVLGFAGDGSEQVFRNEVLHLEQLAAQRLDAAGRVLVLANHPHAPPQRPLPAASTANLRAALAGLAKVMDPAEDLLLLYLTTHGTEQHELLLRREGRPDRLLAPEELRAALDDAGIRHRVLVVSACYSGGFAHALRDPDTLLLMAARRDRPSFGCGNDSVATYFGRAWLVDGLNATVDFEQAFARARTAISAREKKEDRLPSLPQLEAGERIGATLRAWRGSFEPGPPLPYPHAEPEDAETASAGAKIIPPLRRAAKSPTP